MGCHSLLLGIAVAAFGAFGAVAQQPNRVQIGVLECRGGASVGFIVGSVTNLGCVLRGDGRRDEPYVATIRKVGLDLGITQETALAWAVFAPVERSGSGDLSGNYAGAQGSASVGVGLGANVLVDAKLSIPGSVVRFAELHPQDDAEVVEQLPAVVALLAEATAVSA